MITLPHHEEYSIEEQGKTGSSLEVVSVFQMLVAWTWLVAAEIARGRHIFIYFEDICHRKITIN